MNYIQKQYITR